jgi:P4 family phage/plasmid primase-like protien
VITFTKFASREATTKAELSATLDQIRVAVLTVSASAKAELPWIKLATFGDLKTERGSLRHDANVQTVTGVEGDYDALDVSPATAVSLLDMAGIRALVYTSPSYAPDRWKWRVLCPLSRPHAPVERRALVARLNGVLGGVLAKESFVQSQAYYYGRVGDNPSHGAWLVDGAPLDTVAGLDEVYPRPVVIPTMRVAGSSTDTGRDALTAACASFASTDADGQRHQYILAATSHVAPFIKAGILDEVEAAEAIRDACTESGRPPHPDEIESAMGGAVEYATAWAPDPLLSWPVTPVALPDDDDDDGVFVPELTEDAVAKAFAERFGQSFKFDVTAGGTGGTDGSGLWFRFDDGTGWSQDQRGAVIETARHLVWRVRKQRKFERDTMAAASTGFTNAVVRFCRFDKRHVMVSSDWDSDPWLLGVQGGQVDLRTGDYTSARADQFIRLRTSVAPAVPGTATPLWTRYLAEATAGDTAYQAWLQRFAGYGLTGDISEEMFAFVYGKGGAGKGTLLSTLEAIMGDYAFKAPTDLFRADSRTNREYQLAKLDGIRMVFSSETEQGTMMAESLVKELTGNEGKVNARHPYGKPFTFAPRFKLVIVGNYAPKLAGRSEQMERRMRVAPFNTLPAVPDTTLKERLRGEYPGILRWMIDGCLAWQRDRLGWCGAVRVASRSYFEEQDTVTLWAGERCSIGSAHRGSPSALLDDFNTWLRARGDKQTDAKSFKESVLTRLPGTEWKISNGARAVIGLTLRAKQTDDFAGLLS